MNPRVTRVSRRRRIALTAAGGVLLTAGAITATVVPGALAAPAGAGLNITVADTHFILDQITLSEAHAAKENPACAPPLTVANCATPGTVTLTGPQALTGQGLQGIRQVDGRNNNIATGFSPWNGRGYNATVGNSAWGAADQFFPVLTGLNWRNALVTGTATPAPYSDRTQNLDDDSARTASNLIADQSPGNPAAAAAGLGNPVGIDGSLLIPNKAPAGGVAPPYNGMFALFGQFFDHGLDLVDKDAAHFVKVNLKPDDPLYDPLCTPGPACNAMYLSRTTLNGTSQARNTTTPWIDQNQTYTSHPSHQFFLREYVCQGAPAQVVCTTANPPVATGKLADSTNPAHAGDLANWAEVKTQAHDKLGIDLADYDVNDVPIVLTDEYGRFIRGPQGFPLLVQANNTTVVEGTPAAPSQTVDLTVATAPTGPRNLVARTGHAFVNDMAQGASPAYTDVGGTWTNGAARVTNLGRHFVMGDGRGNENIGLTAIHTVFHAEHNRLVDDLKAVITSSGDPAFIAQWHVGGNAANDWDGEKLLQGARLITEMEYQHLVFGEFARLIEPGIAAFTQYNATLRPDISAEFAHAVYRFGHSMLNPTVDRELANGTQVATPLLQAFTNPTLFNDNGSGGNLTGPQAAGAVARGMTSQVGNEMDEFVTDTLRNRLLGQPLDLATLNILRGRDTGTQPLNGARRALFASSNGDPSLTPYTNWNQFGLSLRHPESLVNFVATYGKHPSITSATTLATKRTAADLLVNGGGAAPPDRADFMNGTGAYADVAGKPSPLTGIEDIDLWIGGLAEKPVNSLAGSMLGGTFAYIFRNQLEHLQDSDRFYYLGRLAGTNLNNAVEGNTFAEMVLRNTDATSIPVNAFLHPTNIFDMNKPAPAAITVDAAGKWTYPGAGDSVFTGTPLGDAMQGGTGDDTMRGNDGDDRVEGWLGNDNVVGGLGNDILTDSGGANLFTGGEGNDYMSGQGGDQYLGGLGNDMMVGTSAPTDMVGGPGNDLMHTGPSSDLATGDDQSDWIDGDTGIDTLTGDSAPPFSIDLNAPGDDVVHGGTGGDIVNGDGGVDLFTSTNSGEGDAVAGGFGFDWQTYGDATNPVDADLNLGAPPAGVLTKPDTFLDVEAVSGGGANDTLKGDNRTDLLSATPGQNDNLNQPDIAKFRGLDTLLGLGAVGWTQGNILLGGAGSDSLEGRGGNDLIDGDASLVVRISVPATPASASCPGITGTFITDPADATRVLVPSLIQLRQATLAGCLDPGSAQFVRTIAPGAPGAADVAVFTGNKADYAVSGPPAHLTVVDNRPGSPDGTDTVANVETLQFADGTVPTGSPIGPGAMPAAAEVAPASLVAGATGKVTVNFTTSQVLPAKGTVKVTFPAGFDVNGIASVVAVNSGLDGTASASVNGQVVTITRSGASTDSAPGPKSVTLSGITNPVAPGATAAFDIVTTNATPSSLEAGVAPPVTITAVPAPPAAPPAGNPPAAAPPAQQGGAANPAPLEANRPAVVSLGRSSASRKGRVVTLVVIPTNANGAVVQWKATLSVGRSKKTVTGAVPAGASRQVVKVTAPATWKGRTISVVLTPAAGGTVRSITLR